MAAKHEPRCDKQHTDRQACNSSLEQRPASPASSETPRPVIDSIDKTSPVLEAPPAPRALTSFERMNDARTIPVERRNGEAAALEGDTWPRPTMPSPSPWATRAWEDTAAAVGATATPAPPPQLAGDGVQRATQPNGSIGHIAVAAGIAGAAAIALVIVAQRRR